MKQTIIILLGAVMVLYFVSGWAQRRTNTPEYMTDEQLNAAIDSLVEVEQPLTAAPLIAEAKKRASGHEDTKWMLSIIKKEITINRRRLLRTVTLEEQVSKDKENAWTPLRQMLSLAVYMNNSDKALIADALAEPEKLKAIKAADVVDDNELDKSLSLYDYIAMNIVIKGSDDDVNAGSMTSEQLKAATASLGQFAASSVEMPTGMGVLRDMARQAVDTADDFAEALVQALRIDVLEKAFGWAVDEEEYVNMIGELKQYGEKSEGGKALARFVEANYKVLCSTNSPEMGVADANLLLDTAIVLYGEASSLLPTQELRDKARSKIDLIQQKEVSLGSDSQVLPGQYIPVFLRYRNVSEVVLKVYEAGSTGRLVVGESLSQTLASHRVVETRKVELPSVRSRIHLATAYTELNGVPAGDYVMAAYVEGRTEPMSVTPLVSSSIGVDVLRSNKERRLFFSNAQTGRAISGLLMDGKASVDAEGWADVPNVRGAVKSTAQVGNDKLRFSYSNWSSSSAVKEDRSEVRYSMITDRSIYRPGQKMMFKLYAYKAYRDKMEALAADHECEVVLHAANGQKLSRQKLKTNAYGTLSGILDIPDDAYKGYCYVEVVPNGRKRGSVIVSSGLRIEDFKRTDNTVSFDPIDEVVLPGSSVNISGVCRAASGLPVVGATVNYAVRSWDDKRVEGTVKTDDEGRFSFSYVAKLDDKVSEDEEEFSSVVSVSVTDSKGETTQAETSVNVTADGSYIAVETPRVILGEAAKLKLRSENSNGRPYASHVKVAIYEYAEAGPLKPRMNIQPDTVIGASHQAKDYARKLGKKISEREYDVKGESEVELEGASLSAREYLVVATTTSAGGRPLKSEAHMMVVADEGASSDLQPLTVESPAEVYAGDTLCVRVSSGLADARVLVVVSYGGKMALKQFVELSESVSKVRCQIPKELNEGDNIVVCALTRKDGRRYESVAHVNVRTRKEELNLRLTTFRDHAQPGSREVWELETGKDIETEIAASMYDTRLDKYVSNRWMVSFNRIMEYNMLDVSNVQPEQVNITGRTPHTLVRFDSYSRGAVGMVGSLTDGMFQNVGRYFDVMKYGFYTDYKMRRVALGAKNAVYEEDCAVMECADVETSNMMVMSSKKMMGASAAMPEAPADAGGADDTDVAPRSDFSETVFFLPELHPDGDGKCRLEFNLPDNLTTYAFRAVAHDKTMRMATAEATLVVCKALNVRLGVPRFVVEGDTIEIAADIQVRDDSLTEATVGFACTDAESGKTIGEWDGGRLDFSETRSQRAACRIVVPSGVGVMRLKCTASSDKASDGEQYDIVVERRNIEMPESQSFTLIGKGKREVKNPYQTGETKALTFTYTSNAFIEVLRSLPYLDKSWYPSTDTYIGRYETSAIASYLKQKEDIRKAVDYLKAHEGSLPHTLSGGEGTPWLMMAHNLRQHDKDVVRLMSGDYAETNRRKAVSKLSQMQLSDGSFPWFKGMEGSEMMTVSVVSTFGELIRLGIVNGGDADVNSILKKALPYLDKRIAKAVGDHKEWQAKATEEERAKTLPLSYSALNLLYARSLVSTKPTSDIKYLTEVLRSRWQYGSMSSRVMAATALCRLGDRATADIIVKSLEENLEKGEGTARVVETGLFHSSQELEAQSMLILTLGQLDQESENIQMLVNHLILRKRGEHWDGTQTTSRAVLALLSASSELEEVDAVSVGGNSFKTSVAQPEVKVALPNPAKAKSAKISKGGKSPSWGSWQRISVTPIDKMPSDGNETLSIERTVELRRGGEWQALGDAQLHVGDQLRVSLTVRNDKPLSYVRLTDKRASSLEPVDKLSGYRGWWFWRWTNADIPTPPHYMEIGDTEVDFFVEHLDEGTHKVSYELVVTHTGSFAGGYSSGECLYTPEIKAHSAGSTLQVVE